MSATIQKIQELSEQYHSEIVEIRRHMHQYPELSFQEYETSKFIQKELDKIGVPYHNDIADNGIAALIEGEGGEGPTVALRADFDALPIKEANEVPYKSRHEGIMHACGHDVHTSSLLGATKILYDLKSQIRGTIKLIFQPGEEKVPGGAHKMIQEGVLQNPEPQSIFGQHVMPELETGKVGFRPGKYMASADELFITVHGKGGHAAMPDMNVDPVVITSQLISSLQQIVSRNSPPFTQSVLSIGKLWADGATNVIPNKVEMEGTFRTFDEEWRNKAHERISEICHNTAKALGGSCELDIKRGYPYVNNDPELTELARNAAGEYMGPENVVDLDMRATAEDFAYYTHEIPGCFYRLGTGNKAKGITSSIHTPTFNVDEASLKTGMGLMAYLAVKKLEG